VRTCPACGEDTEAGYSQPGTQCGFSAAGNGAVDDAATITVGDERSAPVASPAEADEGADERSAPKRQRSRVRILVWVAALGALFAVDRLGVFDPAPGPDADQVEQAIVDNADDYGATVTVDCPGDADQAEVGDTFTCTVTPERGKAFAITVTNREDSFAWDSAQLSTLR